MRLLLYSLLLGSVANASTILFSDLGSGGSVYTADQSEIGEQGNGPTLEHASLFTVAGSGSFNLTQIDLGVAKDPSFTGTFTISVWTDNGGVPGTELGSWNMSTTNPPSTCCALATQTGITGVSLVGGTQYFLVMAPQVPGDSSKVYWQPNSAGTTHTTLGSVNNGASWISEPGVKIEAYDVLGDPVSAVPEPATFALMAAGLVVAFAKRKRV